METVKESAESNISLGHPADRQDRLLSIAGRREEPLSAEWSADSGSSWQPATIYMGATVDAWRCGDVEAWNEAALEGQIPPGEQTCVWNYFCDCGRASGEMLFRLRSVKRGKVVLGQTLDLVSDTTVIDYENVVDLAGGSLPEPWSLSLSGPEEQRVSVLVGRVESTPHASEYPTSHVDNAHLPPLSLFPDLKGWHRIYVAMEPGTSVQFSLSEERTVVPVPGEEDKRSLREYCVGSADLTGQAILLAPGGSRVWCDARIRHVRFVPMTAAEVTAFCQARALSQVQGRPFAGYVEQVTAGYYCGETIGLREYTRNEMQLHKQRGCTEVYAHVIRIGFSAWYHSNVVERYLPQGREFEEKDPAQLKWYGWMKQGDPMAVAVEEAHGADLEIFADIGMNITYLGADRFHYAAFTSRFATEHPEYACPEGKAFLDYRHPAVQDYAVSIVQELMTSYDVDGVHLDFARFAHNRAFDEASLVSVVQRIHQHRKEIETQRGRPLKIGVRIPSYLYHTWEQYAGDFPEFVAALRVWAQSGWIDHVMVCSMLAPRLHELSLTRYSEVIKGTQAKLWGDLYAIPAGLPGSYLLDVARKWREEGVEGGFFLYDSGRPVDLSQINWKLRLIDMPECWDALG
jgi:glycosyl hydrolase family 10